MFNYAAATEAVRALARTNPPIAYTTHARERMTEREINERDIRFVLKNGHVIHYEDKPQGRLLRVEGTTANGKQIKVVVTTPDRPLVVVTVFRA